MTHYKIPLTVLSALLVLGVPVHAQTPPQRGRGPGPLLPREAHMAALPGGATGDKVNKLVIVDRYGNVRRIEAIVDALTR